MKKDLEEVGFKPEVQSLAYFQDDYGLKGEGGEEEDDEDDEDEDDEYEEDDAEDGKEAESE